MSPCKGRVSTTTHPTNICSQESTSMEVPHGISSIQPTLLCCRKAPAHNPGNQNSVPQQPYSQVSPYGNTNTTFQSPSPYNQFAQFNNRGPMSNYGRQSNIDPSLGAESTALRQQQQSPYQQAMRTVTPNGQPTITPQALQQNGSSLPAARATASPYQVYLSRFLSCQHGLTAIHRYLNQQLKSLLNVQIQPQRKLAHQ